MLVWKYSYVAYIYIYMYIYMCIIQTLSAFILFCWSTLPRAFICRKSLWPFLWDNAKATHWKVSHSECLWLLHIDEKYWAFRKPVPERGWRQETIAPQLSQSLISKSKYFVLQIKLYINSVKPLKLINFLKSALNESEREKKSLAKLTISDENNYTIINKSFQL